MRIAHRLAVLAVRQFAEGACRAVGVAGAGYAVDKAAAVLRQHFTDHSERLPDALNRANDKAWKALEIALAGDSFWDRARRTVTGGEQKGFREQVKRLIDEAYFADFAEQLNFRPDGLKELHAARKAGLLELGHYDPERLAEDASHFGDPTHGAARGVEVVGLMAGELNSAGHRKLAKLVGLTPPAGGDPILVAAVQYFFRRAVEDDAKLFQGLAFAQLQKLNDDQERLFAGLDAAIAQVADAVLDIREEQRRQGETANNIYDAVIDLQNKLDLLQRREVRAGDSLSIRSNSERELVKRVIGQYRDMPEADRDRLPALLNAVGKLELAAGDFGAARADFAAAADMVGDTSLRAEAHFNAFHASLEARDWDTALAEYRAALEGDPARFGLFPADKYDPVRVLGAGGFGTAFLCRHQFFDGEVVVKTLADDGFDRDIADVFAEAQALRRVDHPAIVRVHDCGYADGPRRERPYIVMDYFAGRTLEDHVREAGPLGVDDFLAVALAAVRALAAAHGQDILHRDVKPGNLLVAQGDAGWGVRLIDFGLALRDPASATAAGSKTLAGEQVAGTLEYAAPEQMGKLDEPVGVASDVYGFGRLACFALGGEPEPRRKLLRDLPEALADLLEDCTEKSPADRPKSMHEVEQRLLKLRPRQPVSAPAPPAEDSLPVSLGVLRAEVADCAKCAPLVRNRTAPVFGSGPAGAELMVVGEAPGMEEDRRGEPFIGQAGQLLDRILAACGFARQEVYITNLVKCQPPRNRKPTPHECGNCRGFLDREIDLVKPKFICALGGSAAQTLLDRADSIGALRGKRHEYRGVPVVCTYHPAYLLPGRSPESKPKVWADMQFLLKEMGRPVAGGNRFHAPF